MKSIEGMVAAKAAEIQGKAPKRKAKAVWSPPTFQDFAKGNVLAFDQTFTNTGFCHFMVDDSSVVVVCKGSIKEPPLPDITGQEDTLQRATWMVQRICNVVDEQKKWTRMWSGDDWPMTVVHERPAVGGHRIESSLLGGLGVWLACSPDKPTIISNTHMRAVLTGQPRAASKALITAAVNRYTDTKGWNADQRDALALGLTFLYDRKRAT